MTTLNSAMNLFLEGWEGVSGEKESRPVRTCLQALALYTGDRPLNEIDEQALNSYLQHVQERISSEEDTPELEYEAVLDPHVMVWDLKIFFTWCQDGGLLDDNPALRLQEPPLPEWRQDLHDAGTSGRLSDGGGDCPTSDRARTGSGGFFSRLLQAVRFGG